MCKPGYMGDKCQYCESEDLIISGTNGIVNATNGFGVNCSKHTWISRIIHFEMTQISMKTVRVEKC